MKRKILAILNLILLLTIINGLTYSHWQDTIQIQGTIKMGHQKLIIDSEKLLVPTSTGFNETHPIYYYVTPDNQSLIAECQNVDHNWTIAIGLLTKNEGTLPLTLKQTQITFNITDTKNFTIITYYYGSFPPGVNFNFPYWDGISFDEVPPVGDTSPPIPLDPNEHAITWTTINHNGTQPLNIQVTATPIDDPYQ
jgi:hypothetical protein